MLCCNIVKLLYYIYDSMNTDLISYLEGFLTEKRCALFKEVLSKRTRHFTVVLEDIYQPHNSSAVVRSCDIFGIQDLHFIENRHLNKVKLNRRIPCVFRLSLINK